MFEIVSENFHVAAGYQPLFAEIGLNAETVFNDPRIQVWRSLPDRENAKLDFVRATGQAIRLHVKRYPPHASSMAGRELTGYQLLHQQNIPAAPIIAHGRNSVGGTFIILEDLSGYTPADKMLQEGLAFDRVSQATAKLAALLHDSGLHHRDLYLCHFMIKTSDESVDVKLIDMARVDRLRSALTRRRWIVKDLGQFWYSTQSLAVTETQRVIWLEQYAQQRGIVAEKLIDSVRAKAAAIAKHDLRLRKSQPSRNISID